MATTLASFRAWLRLDLNDPAGASQRFADADLDRAVERAVVEFSRAVPRVRDAVLATVASSRDVTLVTLVGLWAVLEVEWPTGEWPFAMVPFLLSPDRQTLTLVVDPAPSAVENVRVRWTSKHTVDVAASTVLEEHEALVALGGYGYACLAYSTPAGDNFRYQDGDQAAVVDTSMIPREWRARGEAALARFREMLGDLRRSRALAGTPGAPAKGGARVVWSQQRDTPYWPLGAEREP